VNAEFKLNCHRESAASGRGDPALRLSQVLGLVETARWIASSLRFSQ
jgi:hypothetical protein